MAPAEPGRGRRPRFRTGTARADERFDAAAANTEMAQKLLRNGLRRRARSLGLELRHSDYGYALVDGARNRIDGRNDLTLADVAKYLEAQQQ